ncbi:MAG: EVE domain-containing protein [Chloroherpetonaceae bacterium]|nr:EVE domain-containing protein [Chloroherpetonaceae bacterium]MDW8437408.1 hypothetical protein [Chloroherpetonaceae bacterium]
MGAHVFIADSETFPILRDNGFLAVYREDQTRDLWEKTRADILADLCCLRIGDRIFFYETNRGFHGIYRVRSLPFTDETRFGSVGADAPYRVLIEPLHYFPNPVSELRVLGLKNSANELRSLFYKKALQRGKAITHLFPEEERKLTELLLKANDGEAKLAVSLYEPHDKPPITFDLEPSENGEVKYEKILEGWLMQHIDKPEFKCDLFLRDLNDIETFANYVPTNIAGGNIDVIVYHKRAMNGVEMRYKISVIELKKGKIDESAVIEIEEYVKWAGEHLANNDVEMVQPVLIGKKVNERAIARCKCYGISGRKPILIEYAILPNYQISFSRKDY